MTNKEFNEEMRQRFLKFSILLVRFLETVPYNTATRVMSFQLGKSGTSMGSNHRAYCRGRSKQERFAKICIVVEEADETHYWLEIFKSTTYGDRPMLNQLYDDCLEFVKISTSIKDSTFPD